MSKVEQVVSKAEYEIVVTVVMLQIVAGVLVDDAKHVYGWTRCLHGAVMDEVKQTYGWIRYLGALHA